MSDGRISKYSQGELTALAALVGQLGLTEYFGGEASLWGADPILRSPHRLGEAISNLLLLDGIAASAIWQYRTGQTNDLDLNILDAIHHLHPTHFLWQADHHLNLGAEDVPTNGMYQCRDGRFIMIEAGPPYPQLQNGYLNFFNCGNSRQALAAAIANWPSVLLEESLAVAGLPGCIALTREEWRNHPQGKLLAQAPLIEIEKIGESAPQPFSPNPASALAGIKVLDFTHVLAGPRSTRTLAEFGAKVLHLSSPYHADTAIQNLLVNHGKRSAYLDMHSAGAKPRLDALLADADVFAFSYRPSIAEKFQITPAEVAGLSKKGIVHLSVNAYGHAGPWRQRPGFDQNGQVATGFAVEEGSLDQPRFTPVFYLNDLIAGYAAAAGMMAALLRRACEGGSYHVKVSLARSAMWVQDLGGVEQAQWSAAPGSDTYPANLTSAQTAFGKLTYLAPAVRFSTLPKVDLLPVAPYGAHAASWEQDW
ncbi:acyl-CoA hydratase [Chitinimonas arctica]|uniref:Acyl-CoA hydratase n=1 Tax=Chitinimonas arctica TaxID=2594795 RepID=A0A516SJ29_9NEIS|nr:CoA transferase [Chitinimonas arctica]QDQ28165.1 acyl-CoA hydratase [Chitinimonas arctica]